MLTASSPATTPRNFNGLRAARRGSCGIAGRWLREQKHGEKPGKVGRPRLDQELRTLIARIARENTQWGLRYNLRQLPMNIWPPRSLPGCLLLLPLAVCLGCSSVRVTEPSRTATEQFLLSRAAKGAVAQLAAGALRGRKVFVETAYFAAAEQAFVIGELRAHLLQAGVVGVEDCSAEVFGHCRAFRLASGGVWRTGYCTGGQAASGTPWRGAL